MVFTEMRFDSSIINNFMTVRKVMLVVAMGENILREYM
jgi:hypothetical protein